MAVIRRRVRSRPVRLFLIGMFAVPLVSVVGLWAFATSITVSSAINNHNYNSTTRAITSQGALLSVGLTDERAQTYLWLAAGAKTAGNSMIASRRLVDHALPMARASLTAGGIPLAAAAESAFRRWGAELGRLPAIRAAVDSGAMTPSAAFEAYTTIIDGEFDTYYSAIQDAGAALAQPAIGAADAAYANEMANRETVLVDGALADGGTLSPAARHAFAIAAANRKLLMNQVSALLPVSMGAPYAAIANSAQYRRFQTMENQISASVGSGGPLPLSASAWQSASQGYLNSMLEAELGSGGQLAAMAASLSDRSLTEAVLAGGVGLVAVVASIALMTWFGRKLTRDLGSLHGSVREMAEERLPRVVERLRRGDDVDVHAESPPPPASDIREISQIARSFATVQEAAVAAAVDQARLSKGISQVFLNISMRSQSLLHRQLGMLDSMERRTSEPTALADLFRIDHLTTRMRRHAEGLIILSGSTPARGWRNPVPVVDVLRAAVAEVEEYVRVDVVSECLDLIAGNAVNDTIHLFAELIENATVFSPPNTRVEVRAERVGVGLAVEIEDRGLGLTEEEFASINRRLASPAEFDLANSEQLGLFVVSRLAARHAITVTLRRSVYGGTTAILLLPFGVIVRAEDALAPVRREELYPAPGVAAVLSEPGGRYHRLRAAATGRRTDADVPGSTTAEPALRHAHPATPWTGAFTPGTGRPEPHFPVGGNQPAGTGTASSGSHLGMPVRVPQANLAPQLRARQTGPQAVAGQAPVVTGRSPEATRDMLMSMQHGWERGRLDDLDDPEAAPGNGTGR